MPRIRMGVSFIKRLLKILNILFYAVVGTVMLASVGSAILQKPILLTAIKSGSMTPLFVRGDMVVVTPLADGNQCKVGDIVLFRAPEGSLSGLGWICHRIVGGDAQTGFITRGDANKFPDQRLRGDLPIQPEWIGGQVPQMDGRVLRIRLLGYLTIGMEALNKTPFTLPALIAVLAILLVLGERRNRHRRRAKVSTATIYMMTGIVISVVVGASMLATSQHITFNYRVGESQAAMTGSAVGMLTPGQEVSQELTNLSNKGFLPIVATITSRDDQLSFSHGNPLLRNGTEVDATVTVSAREKGVYNSVIDVGLFYPFLPRGAIYALSSQSYWLALVVLALLPGLPLLFLSLLDWKKRH